MISALDTNVILDVWLPDPKFGDVSARTLARAYDEGGLIICEIVYAELAPHFSERSRLDAALAHLAVHTQGIGRETAWEAGRAWHAYRLRGGKRDRILADFLIGAHALRSAERLVTRDRGFYGSSFPDLRLLDPTA